MTKVFFIINCYSKGGGAEALLTSIVNNLNPQKYDIGIMEIIHEYIKEEPIKPYIKRYPYYTLADAPDRKARMYYVYHEWNKVIEEYIPKDYDVYISFNYLKPSFLLPSNGKNIAWIHGDVYKLLADNKKEERELQDIAFEKAKKIIVISDITERSVKDLFPRHKNKITKLYNSIDCQRVVNASKEACNIKLAEKAVIVVGRLDDNKNPLRALVIFEEVLKKVPDAILYFLGEGILENEIKQELYKKKIENSVVLLGYYNNPYPIMKQAKVMLMTSKSEGYGLVIAESICLGVPVVSTRVGAAEREINSTKCGRVIDTDEEAVNAIVYYLGNAFDGASKAMASSKLMHNFKKYIEVIENLIDETAKA